MKKIKFILYVIIFLGLVIGNNFAFAQEKNIQKPLVNDSKNDTTVELSDIYSYISNRDDSLSDKMLAYSSAALQHSKDTINYFLYILGFLTILTIIFGWKTLRDVKKDTRKRANKIAKQEINKIASKLQSQINKIDEKVNEKMKSSSLWRQLKETDDLNKQLEIIDKLIEEDPNDFTFYGTKGSILKNLDKCEDALEYFNKAIKINPEAALAYKDKAECLQELKRYDEAVESINKAIEINNNMVRYYEIKADILGDIKEYEEAIKIYKKARNMEISQRNGVCRYSSYSINISYWYHKLRKFNEAYDEARIGLNFQFRLELAVNKGLAAAGINKRDEAISLLKMAEETGMRYSEVLYCQARMYSLLKDHDNALNYFKRAVNEDSKWIKEARCEDDFKFILNTKDFQKILNSSND